MVTQKEMENAFLALGLVQGDLVLVHSSLKSLGMVENGAEAVIGALQNVLTESGTLVMPTLSQKDFENAYREWSLDRPSDTGLITETFRKMPGTLRSDQETHSVAAWGKYAEQLTFEHKKFGPRECPFGPYAFSHSSPWQKLYDRYGKVVFIGVTMKYNTMKHFIESRLVEEALNGADCSVYKECKEQINNRFIPGRENGVWPYYNSEQMQEELEKLGLVRSVFCGAATIICVPIHEMADETTRILKSDPERWFDSRSNEWFLRCAGSPDS